MIELFGHQYEVMENIKDGFHKEAVQERFAEILKKYDYVVGDWGYEQLRLKGFYNDEHPKATYDTKFSALDDYLYEYCNFGCAYFILKKVVRKK
ncbi:YutD family protein [Virgibacillus soli]|uniref:YutD family protein n=1 Tax=Paracerasibacillus soli TaxID=480284 RepID=A0ABU5CSH6_9BACI|nr:YutD family protein [Virgibacillus soli]MDY0408792.1 YutD family protein [Virgibacillus soli]